MHRKIGYNAKGILVNTNTIEEFRSIDKSQLFQQITDKVNNYTSDTSYLNVCR